MYIKATRRCYAGTEQHTGRQWFLLLVEPGKKVKSLSGYEYYASDMGGPRPRAIVRKVALGQLGHFMMGYAHAFGHKIPCTGDYGNLGLICSVDKDVYDKAVELPEEVYQAWATDTTGWNSAGKSGVPLRKWAIENFSELAPVGATY